MSSYYRDRGEYKEMPNPYVEERRKNIQFLRKLIKKEGKIEHKKALAYMGIYGITDKTTNTYLATLSNAGFIKYDVLSENWEYIGDEATEEA